MIKVRNWKGKRRYLIWILNMIVLVQLTVLSISWKLVYHFLLVYLQFIMLIDNLKWSISVLKRWCVNTGWIPALKPQCLLPSCERSFLTNLNHIRENLIFTTNFSNNVILICNLGTSHNPLLSLFFGKRLAWLWWACFLQLEG